MLGILNPSWTPKEKGEALFGAIVLAIVLTLCSCQSAPTSPNPANPGPLVSSECNSGPTTIEIPKIASCVAYGESEQASVMGALKAWSRWDTRWDHKEVTVRFLNGTPSLQRRTFAYFKQWDDQLNGLCFRIVATGPADIRVRFGDGGHWSYVGNEARGIPSNLQTMNLDFSALEAESEIRRVTLHEVGHAFGLEHEHQHPEHGIPWNREATLRYYMTTQGWTEAEVEQQVLKKYTGNKFRGTKFDPNSIMQYPVPAELTTNGFSVGWNSQLSPLDLVFAKIMYP